MFLLNELSVHNQYQTLSDFELSLHSVLGCRNMLRKHQRALRCGRGTLGGRQVFNEMVFRQAVGNIKDKNIKRAVLLWVDRDGPFWEDEKIHSADEYFSDSEENLVTDTMLAEAAFRIYQNLDSWVVSFSPSNYSYTPLVIKWHKTAENQADISVVNYWEVGSLSDLLNKLQPPIQTWGQLVEYSKIHFENLVFLSSFESGLKGQPFSHTIADHALFLLNILDELKTSFDDDGHRTKKGEDIIENFCTGDRAKFSDESPTNKIVFKKELTFKKDDMTDIFCPFHGKISHNYYRLHVSWPVTKNDPLYIAYLGPKITKG